jgi:hypothetical protein
LFRNRNPIGTTGMADQPEALGQISSRARKSFDEARTAMNGVSKTAALWAGALAIVWISSLAPTVRSVVTTARTFEQLNASRQEAERRATILLLRVAAEQEEIERLKGFEEQYPTEQKRDQERTRLDRKLKDSQKELDACEGPEACRKAEAAVDRASNEKQQFQANEKKLAGPSLADREARLSAEKEKLNKEPKRLEGIYAEARRQAQAQERNVSFDLFGLKFKASPLLAPLLWCILSVALLGYLATVRARSIMHCVQGFRTLAQSPSLSGDELANLTGRLPTWAVGPALAAYASTPWSGQDRTQLVREPWVNHAFGSLRERQFVAALAVLIPFLAWVTELRVAWIALEFSRYLGMTRGRALLPLALLAIFGTTVWIGGWWFFGERGIRLLDRGRRRWLVGLCGILLAAMSVVGWYPPIGIRLGFLLQQSLLWMALISVGLLLMGVSACMYSAKGIAKRVFPVSDRGYTRRGAMIAIAGIAGLVMLTVLLPSLRRAARKGNNRKRGPLRLSLEQGFYRRQSPKEGKKAPRPVVLHYIGPKGRFSNRGSLPKRLEKEPPPASLRYGVVDVVGQGHQKASLVAIALSPVRQGEREGPQQEMSVAANLRTGTPQPVGKPRLPRPRVHLATASWSFEEAALAIIRKGAIDRKRSKEICQLLLCGIQHDFVFKQRLGNKGEKGRPSFRLYDLLAGISVRYQQEKYFDRMLELIERSEQRLFFQTRIEKWQDVTGPWRQRWRNRREPVTWKSNSGAVIFR